MAAILMHLMTRRLKHLCSQQTEFAIAEHGNHRARWNCSLIQDFAGRREWLHKNSSVIGKVGGNDVQIRFRQCEKFAKCAWMLHNSQDLSCRTMTLKAALAPVTSPAGQIDFAGNAPA